MTLVEGDSDYHNIFPSFHSYLMMETKLMSLVTTGQDNLVMAERTAR